MPREVECVERHLCRRLAYRLCREHANALAGARCLRIVEVHQTLKFSGSDGERVGHLGQGLAEHVNVVAERSIRSQCNAPD